MVLVSYLIWAIISALLGGLVAVALNKWAASWSLVTRILVAVTASISPTFGLVGYFFAQLGPISLWTSPDEFLIPFAFQVFLILVISTAVAWLVCRRGARSPVPTDVFN